MRPPKQVSIEYAHIYTNNHISEEHALSLAILKELYQTYERDRSSLVVLIDDYSFPDPTFNYHGFQGWLKEQGFRPDVMARESQLIPLCDHIINALEKPAVRDQICDYVRTKNTLAACSSPPGIYSALAISLRSYFHQSSPPND